MASKKELLAKINEFEYWVNNISSIQKQLLNELGYEIKHRMPNESYVYIQKIKKERKDDEGQENINN